MRFALRLAPLLAIALVFGIAAGTWWLFIIGAGVGLPLGGFLAQTYDWHVVLWLPGVLALLMVLLVRATVAESTVRSPGA